MSRQGRKSPSPARIWIALVAAGLAIGAAAEIAAQTVPVADPAPADIVSIRSSGRPPPGLESVVAAVTMRSPRTVRADETADSLIKRVCGYESKNLAEMVLKENAEAFTERKAREEKQVSVPACILAVLSSEYTTTRDDNLSNITRDKMGFGIDATVRRTLPPSRRTVPEDRLFDEFCRLNSAVPGMTAACSGQTVPLPENRKLILPARAISTDLKLSPPDPALDAEAKSNHYKEAAGKIQLAINSVGSVPFLMVSKGPIKPEALRQRPQWPDSCPVATSAFDADRVFQLWQAYGPSYPVVLTIMDSGLAPGSILDQFIFAPFVAGVQEGPDGNNAEDAAVSSRPEKRARSNYGALLDCNESGPNFPMCKLDPKLVGFHGTHVAGLALGGQGFIEKLAPESTPGKPKLLSLRIFRNLDLGAGTDLYSHTPQGLGNGFNWAQSRRASPLNVVNFSIGIKSEILGVTPAEIEKNRILFVSSAGNDGKELRPTNDNADPSLISYYPALLGGKSRKYFITVGNASPDGKPHTSSNKSKEFVDLFAVGECQSSFGYDGVIKIATGTSQAAPLVSFAAALLRTMDDSFSDPGLVKSRLVDTSDFSKALASASWSGGLLNILQAIDLRADYVTYLEPGSTVAKTIRGILAEDNPVLCDNQYPKDVTKFHRMSNTSDALYRTRTSDAFGLDSCSIAAETETKMLRIRTFTRTKSDMMDIPVAQVRSIIGRYVTTVDDTFMQKTSVDP